MISQRRPLASIFLTLINLVAAIRAQVACLNNGNYTSNTTYESNLETLLSSLPANVDDNGFYNASLGQNPDTVYASVLCRGDVQLDMCQTCIQETANETVNSCPKYKQAVTWSEICTLRYSNESMFGIMTEVPLFYQWNVINVSSPHHFMADVKTLLGDIGIQAAYGGSLRKVAAGNRSTVDLYIVFSLVQCTPDLSVEDCSSCLSVAAANIQDYCYGNIGCRMLSPSCNIRYEDVPFYNETRLQELQVLTLPPPPSLSPTLSPLPGKKDGNRTRTIIIAVVSIVVSLIVAVWGGILLIMRTKTKPEEEIKSAHDINVAESLQYDFHVIKVATDDFSDANKLGQGGFGSVYKGKLPNGQEIAVKRLSMDSGQGHIEFKNEVLLVAKLQHRNLVRLLGFSMEGNERLLVYEFVQNASLEKFIFDPIKCNDLDWERRYKIIVGTSKGLLYLHEESRLKIIHRDLKASNILLDEDMNPKIADFGMARLFDADETQGNTNRIVGTYGYMPPEYAMHGQFSVKSDVFSFGVLILEIIAGQRNNSFRYRENMEDLLSVAWKYWHQGTIEDMIDPMLRANLGSVRDMLRCIHIGLLCVQDNPADRPTIASIVLMLSSFTIFLPTLCGINLVRLLGFCIEGNERLLVYEFIKNASLDGFIFDPIKRLDLSFEIRYKIIAGIAKGLLYLHEESRLKIIHRDLKAGNILLDGDMNPKISDFGTARLFATDETQANTDRIVGTHGYMAPEYAMYGHLSVKSDVFSFGVLVLEIVSGRRNRSYQNEENMEDLLSLAWKSWWQGTVEDMLDPILRAGSSTLHDILRCIHIGLLCVQDNPIDRPTMASVVVMLSSFTISLPVPETRHSTIQGYNSSNANFQGSDLNEVVTSKSASLNKSTQSTGSSKNEMSITEFYQR